MKKEFQFFDTEYFKNHNEAQINFYYSGHGNDGTIQLSDFQIKYIDAVQNIIDSADNQTNKIAKKEKKIELKTKKYNKGQA